MTSPCEVCVFYINKHQCHKRGKIKEDIWNGIKNCEEYYDGIDETLTGYKTYITNGEKMLNTKENSGLFTF